MSIDRELVRVKALAHPLRMLIIKTLHKQKEPTSIKTISKLVEAEPSKLHYHFKLLEQAEIIIVTNTRLINGITEKYYSLVGQGDIDLSLKSNQEEVMTILPAMESTALEVIRRIPRLDSDTDGPLYGVIKDFSMSKEVADKYKEALVTFIGGESSLLPVQQKSIDDEGIEYNLMVFLVPKPKSDQ